LVRVGLAVKVAVGPAGAVPTKETMLWAGKE